MLKFVKNALQEPYNHYLESNLEDLCHAALSKVRTKPQAVTVLARLYDEADDKGRFFIVSVLSRMHDATATHFLIRIIADTRQDPLVRDWAVNSFWKSSYKDDSFVSALISIARAEINDNVMRSIVYTLAYYLTEESILFLVAQISNEKLPDYIRALAAEGLGKINDEVPNHLRKITVKALIQHLDDVSPLVRFFCVRALGWIGDKRALPALKAFPDEDYVCEFSNEGTLSDELKEAKKISSEKTFLTPSIAAFST